MARSEAGPEMTAGAAAGAAVGQVVGIYTAPRAGVPMTRQEAVELVAGVGIAGDRYVRREGEVPEGHWKNRRWADQQVTLVEVEKAEEFGIDPALARRNLATRGVRLADLIGRRFAIGDTILQGIRSCTPCNYVEGLSGRPGLRMALGDGGLRAAIDLGGTIRDGDEIRLLPE